MKVPYLDLPAQFKNTPITGKIKKLLADCQFTFGRELAELEEKLAHLCGTKYSIGVSSGTDAIFLSLKAVGVGPGEEVILPPNSFIATAGAVAATGAKPVFVDVDNQYNINTRKIRKAITPKTRAIVPVHLTGNPACMPVIMAIAEEHNLFVIEDAAQAIGSSIGNRPSGSWGNAGAFSLHPLKNLNVWGDGGFITTNSDAIKDKLMLLRNHGLKNRDEVEIFGYNSRLDTLQAIVALNNLDKLESITRTRIQHAEIYDEDFKDLREYVAIPPRPNDFKHVYHTYIVQVKKRKELIEYLKKMGVETRIHYPIPLHLQKACSFLGHNRGDFPVCEEQAEKILSLPVHQNLSTDQIRYVVQCIRDFFWKN